MGDLLIRNIPTAMRSDIQRLANETGQSLSDTAREALRAGVDAMSKRETKAATTPPGERLREIFGGMFETNEEAEEFQRILDEVRRNDFGRPPPFE